jgi:RNA polymerase sigma factor (sigma-70 family)
MMTENHQLLEDFAKTGSEAAFRELVERYLGLVLSTATRLLNGDAAMAQDVAQIVFVDLSRMAGTLSGEVMLGGWLHRHTCFVASKAIRRERLRLQREQQACSMNSEEDHSPQTLARIASVLDEAVEKLGATDREAIVLRYYERMDLRAVGKAMGTNEDAAQKRVARALEKLRVLLGRRGASLSAAALATALSQVAATPVQAGVSAAIALSVLSGKSAGSGAALTLIKIMTLTKMKVGVMTAIAGVAIASPLAYQQHQTNARLQSENAELSRKFSELVKSNQTNKEALNQVQVAQTAASRGQLAEDEKMELLRLRNEVGLLRQQKTKLEAALSVEKGRVGTLEAKSVSVKKDMTSVEQMNMCINNMRQIDGAKQQWALENNKKAEDTPTLDDIQPYFGQRKFPECPAHGAYTIGRVDEMPRCSVSEHVLPQPQPNPSGSE